MRHRDAGYWSALCLDLLADGLQTGLCFETVLFSGFGVGFGERFDKNLCTREG